MMARPRTLGEAFDPRRNSFTFLRLLMAAIVVFYHRYPLSGRGSDSAPLQVLHGPPLFSSLGLTGFFMASGFLITRSYTRSPSLWRYLWHRVLRIFPGFWVALIVTAFLFGPLVTWLEGGSLMGYFRATRDSPFDWLQSNVWLKMNQFDIAGRLQGVPFKGSFNGALWTLVYEFESYLVVALFGALGLLTRRWAVLAFFLFLWATYMVRVYVPGSPAGSIPWLADLDRHRFFVAFWIGAVFFLYRDMIPVHLALFVLAFGLAYAIVYYRPSLLFLLPILNAYVLLYLAARLPLSGWDRIGDYSYGLYIYAFPVQQTLAVLGIHQLGIPVYVAASMLLALPLAWASTRLVERPFLRLKDAQLQLGSNRRPGRGRATRLATQS